uniref:WAT1-related protein n=1 Tax=Oryza glaberrima TaxID=4538 RepID=I1R198_ORYGL
MADHAVHVLSPPCVCATLVGAASFSSLRAAAAAAAASDGHLGRDRQKEEAAAADEHACSSWEDAVIAAGMMGVQLAGAAYMVVLAPAMERGLDPLFLVTFGSLANAAFTLPFSVALERRLLWPPAEQLLTGRLLLRFVLLALGGVTGFQALMLQGMKRTSPAIAAAMPNLTPGFIFLVAASLGLERVRLRCCYTWAKIVGTALCLSGAITMSVIQSATAPPPTSPASGWAAGCFCLLGAVVVVSCTTVLQAATMVGFPAPITLCTVTSFLGAALTAALQLVARGSLAGAGAGAGVVGLRTVLALVLVGGVVSSACVAFQAWALKKKGPVVVSMFSPTQTVGSAVFSAIFLGRVVKSGSVVGMILLFSGLYVVLWAKKKETTIINSDDSCSSMAVASKDGDDPEKQPLLSRRH